VRRVPAPLACSTEPTENEAVRIYTGTLVLALVLAKADGLGVPPARLPQPAAQHAPAPEARVDINRATSEELLKVPGMTRTWAARIVRFRPYRSKQDLLDRGVVSREVYNRIKDYVIAHRIDSGQ